MPMRRLRLLCSFSLLLAVMMLLSAAGMPVYAQQAPLITLEARSGFEGYYASDKWLPLIVTVQNQGDAMQGRLVVRPETSQQGIRHTFSTSVDLPTGADQRITLYVMPSGYTPSLRVELLNVDDTVVASADISLTEIAPTDHFSVVLTEAISGSVDLTASSLDKLKMHQSNWRIQDLPEFPEALAMVRRIMFSDIDTSGISLAQRRALEAWVARGGHLIITGGAAWQPTMAGLGSQLSPFAPSGSVTVSDLNGLSDWLVKSDDLRAQTTVATGAVADGASVLVAQDDVPLLVRRTFGDGMVDYLTVDPHVLPLRNWQYLPDLWLAMLASAPPQKSWSSGIVQASHAIQAVELLPGESVLPDILPLCGFLMLYVVMIGPVNYVVLSRINRRELAWVTIPLLIVLFSSFSWFFGFNLRGTDAKINQLSFVRIWDDYDQAAVMDVIGVLSPLRTQYSLSTEGMLHPVTAQFNYTYMGGTSGFRAQIEQGDQFTAKDFLLDASFVAPFSTTALIDKPNISGSLSVSANATQTALAASINYSIRGSIRNNTDITLRDPVLFASGGVWHLDEDIQPGMVLPIEIMQTWQDFPFSRPTPLVYLPSTSPYTFYRYNPNYYGNTFSGELTTVNSILPIDNTIIYEDDPVGLQETIQDRSFLSSFLVDYFPQIYMGNTNIPGAVGIADQAYLMAWGDETLLDVNLTGGSSSKHGKTFYIIDLAETFKPSNDGVRLMAQQFSWLVESASRQEISPLNTYLNQGEEAIYRFTPHASSVLDVVDQIIIRTENETTLLDIEIYNWASDSWIPVQRSLRQPRAAISDVEGLLGPQNSIRLRVTQPRNATLHYYGRYDSLLIEQYGSFASDD